MNLNPTNHGGWLESLRCIGGSVSALLRSRFELFTVEWQEEKLRLLTLFIWLGLAAAIGATGIFIALMAMAFWLWTVAGYAGVIGLAACALAVAGRLFWSIRKKIQTSPAPFGQTVAEFRKDGVCLRSAD